MRNFFLTDFTVQPPCCDHSQIDVVAGQCSIPFFTVDTGAVGSQEPVHQVNTTHACAVLMDVVGLFDSGGLSTLDATLGFTNRLVALVIVCHMDDRVVIPLADVDNTVTPKVKMASLLLLHFFCTSHQLGSTTSPILSNSSCC